MMQPNIILILTDHFRRDAIGPSTPNLQALAARGTRFCHAYSAAPLCQPARNSLITGMLPSQTGICGNQATPIPAELRDDTFMQHLQKAGYRTAMIGKHHYIDRFGLAVDVCADDDAIKGYGFDDVLQVVDDGENGHNDDAYTAWLAERGLLQQYREALAQHPVKHPFAPEDTAEGFIAHHGLDWVKQRLQQDEDQPWYLNWSFIGPHPPLWNPTDVAQDPNCLPAPKLAASSPDLQQRRARYLQKCHLIDSYVGQMMQCLDEHQAWDNTVIIFTSDHGDMLGDRGIWDKRYLFEESVGVPLVIAGGRTLASERNNGARLSRQLVSHLDLYPTILALAGASTGRSRQRPGQDLIACQDGRVDPHQAIVAELAGMAMLRTPNWKLIVDADGGGVQHLYNLAVDPGEVDNLAGVAGYEAQTTALLQQLLVDHMRRSQYTHQKEEQRLQRVHC